MKDVEQRLVVHLFVFENRPRRLRTDQPRIGRIVNRAGLQRAFDARVAFGRKRGNHIALRPVASVVPARFIAAAGIDAALEEPFEGGIHGGFAEAALVEREVAERRNVSFVERKRMAQRDRTVVKRVLMDEPEEPGGPLTVFAIPLEHARAVDI